MKKKSKGVIIFAWYYVIIALASLVTLIRFDYRVKLYQQKYINLPISFHYANFTYAIITLIIGSIIGIGLFRLIDWARKGVIITSIFDFLFTTVHFIVFTVPLAVPTVEKIGLPLYLLYLTLIFNIFWLVIKIYFFTRPTVKLQFK